MADKYISLISGRPQEVEGTVTSAGAADAGEIVALDSAGKLDLTVLPTGVGPETVSLPTSENLAAGNWVNIWNDAGTIKARKADATSTGKEANGFVKANVTAPANATVYLSGINDAISGLTAGSDYYLSASTPGAGTTAAPSIAGNVVQHLGKALSTTSISFFGSTLGVILA